MVQGDLRRQLIVVLVCLGALTGCARREGIETDVTAEPLPAVQSLVDSAHAARDGGRYDDAAANLERALRLQPENATLWRELADIRYDQGQYGQAASLALRSNSYAPPDLQKDNWIFVAACRRAMGDEDGARQAQAQADAIE